MTEDDTDYMEPGGDAETEEKRDGRRGARGWWATLEYAKQQFDDYQTKCDNIDKLFANMKDLAALGRDRQFQLFWANVQVLAPSIYSRPPQPVVVPRFRERRPVPRTASELLERSVSVGFEKDDINDTMISVRDDLAVLGRGVIWCRYETKGETKDVEKVCAEHTDRKDFLHDPARYWKEVDWVAKASHLNRREMRKRFKDHSGDAYKDAAYVINRDDKENNAADQVPKACVWEIWCKSQNHVYWVTEGVDICLDDGEPHLKLEGFFPCPKPAYSTVQRRTLQPVPDVMFYKDQLEEINELTARISALAGAVKVRAFYPAGAGDIGDAIEAAIKANTDNQIMIPISNWAAFGTSGAKDVIIWLPIDMIVATIKELVALRKELINDVYEITGLSDIMRGSTDPNETLGAQEMKSQYGSIRVRDRQQELVRIARDVTRIAAEIMAENFSKKTLVEMSQMELPTDAEIKGQIAQLKRQADGVKKQAEAAIKQAQQNPQLMQAAEANPEQAQQVVQQIQQQVNQQLQQMEQQAQKLSETVTIDQVMELLREQKLRPFVLDIETDSTIAPDENAQKQRATEFITSVGGFMTQAVAAVKEVPQTAPLMSDMLKYVASQFRAGRQLDASIDEFADQMKAFASQPKPEDPAAIKAKADAEAAQVENATKAQTAQADNAERIANAQQTAAEAQKTMLEAQTKAADAELERRVTEQAEIDAMEERRIERDGKQRLFDLDYANKEQKHAQDMDIGVLQIEKLRLEIEGVQVKTDAALATTAAKIEQTNTQTENAVRTTDANVQATSDKTAIAAEAQANRSKEPA